MRIYWATFFIGTVVVVKQVQAISDGEGRKVCERYASAASIATGDAYEFLDLFEDYPPNYVINEGRVSDLEFMSRKLKKEGR